MSSHRRWEELPEDVRDDLRDRRALNRHRQKAINAEDRRQRQIAKEVLRYRPKNKRPRRSPMELRSLSRIEKDAHAILEAARVLQYALDGVEEKNRKRRPSQRETLTRAIMLYHKWLVRRLKRAAHQNPGLRAAIEAELEQAKEARREKKQPDPLPIKAGPKRDYTTEKPDAFRRWRA